MPRREPSPAARSPHRQRRRVLGPFGAALTLVLVLTGCTATIEPQPSTSPTDETFATRVDIGDGRSMYVECRGTGSPTVVLIGGLRAASDYWDRVGASTPTVFPEVAAFTRVCAYDRPGTVRSDGTVSRSDPIEQPTTQGPAVADLEAVIEVAGIAGPLVLVAHSYGGFIARTYAATHPDSVRGLVLIDTLSEQFESAMTPEQFETWKTTAVLPPEDLATYPDIERLDDDAVMAQMRATAPIGDMPLIVLSADVEYAPIWQSLIDSGVIPAGAPADFGAVIDEAQRSSQAYQAGLVPGAVHITDTHSGHDIPIENPELVIASIRDVVEAVRNG